MADYHEQDWGAEEYSRGGYMSHMPPAALTGFGRALRSPSDRSTGPARKRRRSTTARSTERSARAAAPRTRSWQRTKRARRPRPWPLDERGGLRAILCVAAALALLSAASANAVYPGTNGAVADYDFAFTAPVEWSPDGSRRAYQEDSGGLLVATNADGSGRTVLYDLSAHGYNGLRGFGWSADGAELVIAPYTSCGSSCNPKSDLVVITADGAQQDPIHEHADRQ